MRVFRFIVRFLGISAAVVWLLSNIVFAQQNNDVTVNFPDEMSVSGSVEITNLGITGDPQYNYNDPFGEPDVLNTIENYSINYEMTDTYIDHYDTWSFLKLNVVSPSDPHIAYHDNLFNVQVPVFDWVLLKSNFLTAVFGAKFGNASSPTTSKLFPLLVGGRSDLTHSSIYTGSTVVTDQIGDGTWSINFDWKYFTGLFPSNTVFDWSGWNIQSTLQTAMQILLSLLAWYEVIYLIFIKLSKA